MQKLDRYPEYEFDPATGWPIRIDQNNRLGRKAEYGEVKAKRIGKNREPYFVLKTDKGTYQSVSLTALQRLLRPIFKDGLPIPNFSNYSFDATNLRVFNKSTNRFLKPTGKGGFVRLRNDEGQYVAVAVNTVHRLAKNLRGLPDAAEMVEERCLDYAFDAESGCVWKVRRNGYRLLTPKLLVPDKHGFITLDAEYGPLSEIKHYARDGGGDLIQVDGEGDDYGYLVPVVCRWAKNKRLRVRATPDDVGRLIRALQNYPYDRPE